MDESGSPLAGAIVRVTGRGAVGVHEAVCDAGGRYSIPGLPTRESLEVTARSSGRTPLTYSGIHVRQDFPTTRDFRLRHSGVRDVAVVLDARVPYHVMALEGVRLVLPRPPAVVELTGRPLRDARALRTALASRPSALVAIGSLAARLARREARDVPVVYAMVLDPEVEDLRRVNMCGLTLNGGFDDQLAALASLRPASRGLATIYDPRRTVGPLGRLREAARARGITVTAAPARHSLDVPGALARLETSEHDAFLLLLDPSLFDAAAFELVRRFTQQREMPLIVPDPSLVATGGTFSYGPGFREMGSYAGRLVAHLFSGAAEPADIGERFPTARSMAINPREVERLRIVLPPEWRAPAGSGSPGH